MSEHQPEQPQGHGWPPLPWEGFKGWLAAHGVDVETELVAAIRLEVQVMITAGMTAGPAGVWMRVITYGRDPTTGRVVLDPTTQGPAVTERLVPVRTPPGVIG